MHARLSLTACLAGPISPSTQTQNAGAQALLQLKSLDQALVPLNGGAQPASADRAASSSQEAVRDLFTRVQTFINIVEIDADSLKRKHIRRYMQQARACLEELMETWAGASDVKIE